MKALVASLLAFSAMAGPALALGPALDLPILTFPKSDAVISSQQPGTAPSPAIVQPAK